MRPARHEARRHQLAPRWQGLRRGRGRQFESELARVKGVLQEKGLEHEVRQLVRGNDPAEDLISVAEEEKADFIVIGLRRRSPVGKLILGSNAQRILLDASCPVLAVKARLSAGATGYRGRPGRPVTRKSVTADGAAARETHIGTRSEGSAVNSFTRRPLGVL